MGRWEKLLDRILRPGAEAGIDFDDLCGLLAHLGFEMRYEAAITCSRSRASPTASTCSAMAPRPSRIGYDRCAP